MNKRWFIGCCIFIFLGGCGLMEKDNVNKDIEELPDVTAFQDEFTRGFMASTDEVSDGYYLFESKTGGYTILFPGDARIDEIHYEKVKKGFESIKFGSDSEKHTGESYKVYVMYENPKVPDKPDIQVSFMSKAVHYDGEFEERKFKNVTHYFARQKYESSSKKSSVYHFIGAVESNSTNQYISYTYSVRCP